MTIQRYEPIAKYIGTGDYAAELVADQDGEAVLYTDHLAALAAAAEREKVLVEALEAMSFTFAVEVTAAGRFTDLNMKLIEQSRAALALVKEEKP